MKADESFAGQTVEMARRMLAARFRTQAVEFGRTRRADAGWRGAGSRSHRADRGGGTASSPQRRLCVLKISHGGALQESPSRAFSGSRSSGACPCNSHPQRWCRGRTLKRWSNWPSKFGVAERRRRSASPISAPDRARSCWRCCPNCLRPAVSAPTSVRRRCRSQPAMPLVSGSPRARLSSPATMRRRCRASSI